MIATQNSRPPPFQRLFGPLGLIVLAALYLLAGVAGHDPWRGDDAIHFGPVLGMLQGEGLLFPRIAGDAATQYPPLYYWVAALLAQALGWLLPAHDGARFASALFTGLTLCWTAQAADRLYGRPARAPAVLLTLGTLGLLINAHLTQPMLALLAMQALTLAGLARVPRAPLAGALQAALGAALAFLAAGLSGALLTLPLFVLVLVCAPDCRTPRASGALLLGVCVALVLGMLWPLALHYQHPELFRLWWAEHWGGFGSRLLARDEIGGLLEESGWFLWPLWPIALWALWHGRRRLIGLPILLPLIATLLTAAWVVVDGREPPAGLLPMIPPLALLAAAGAPHLRRGAANAFDWFGVMTLGLFALLVWLGWTAQVFAWPPGLARHVERYGSDFVLHGQTFQAVIGITLTAAWLLLVWRMPRSPNRGPANWALGTTLLWCLAALLLMSWFDHGRSYRAPAESLARVLADEHPDCIATTGLSDDVRVSLDYFAGLRPEPVRAAGSPCRLLLVHDDRRAAPRQLPDEWKLVWEHRRGGGRQLDIFRLYRRD
ncbi:hypothetical protein E6C76_06435 [Pseudothauera nasutitermitis]|uniref:Glycosyltransferase RgtA/B/C/D-like domain-containing protein n=1 Tax=Pseudothauera nasutitermitis TaxID=2565930 RepID=A0A4S4B1U3_9RHOO|nr:hypothetical protein [Pseudothauera nasutitermitis]THF66473.1 hypothetical protein E6C76_06435 [Pseudothauera nasutitermitis]